MEQAHRIKRLKLAASAVGLCGFALVAGATLIPLGELPLGEFQFPGTSVEAEREGQLPTTVFRAASPVAGPALSASDEQCAKDCEKFLNMGPAPDALISYLACLDLCPKPPPKPPPPRPPPDAGVADRSATALLLAIGLLGLCLYATFFRWILQGERN